MTDLDATKMTIAIYDRINVLLLQFEVDMFRPDDDVSLPRGCTHRSYAITQIAHLWNKSETWIHQQLRKANKFIKLMDDHPSYLTEISRKSTAK